MPMNSLKDAETRLRDDRTPINETDVRDLIPWLGSIGGGLIWRLFADLALQNIVAIQKFDQSSRLLSRVLIWLTVGLFLLTAILTYQALMPKG